MCGGSYPRFLRNKIAVRTVASTYYHHPPADKGGMLSNQGALRCWERYHEMLSDQGTWVFE